MTLALPNDLLNIVYEYSQGCKLCLDTYLTITKNLTKKKYNLINQDNDWLSYNFDDSMNITITYNIINNINHDFSYTPYNDGFRELIDMPIIFNKINGELHPSFKHIDSEPMSTIIIPVNILSQFITHSTNMNCNKLYHSYNTIKEERAIILLFYNTLFDKPKNKYLNNCPPSVLSLTTLCIKELYSYTDINSLVSDYIMSITSVGQDSFDVCIDIKFDKNENVIVLVDKIDINYNTNKMFNNKHILSNGLSDFKNNLLIINIMSFFDDIY
jgi:hypothetical protein